MFLIYEREKEAIGKHNVWKDFINTHHYYAKQASFADDS